MIRSKRLCRLCGKHKDRVLLYLFAEENVFLTQEIEFLTKTKPCVNDTLPPYICHRCNYRVTALKDFRNMCIETLHHLQEKSVNSNEDDDEVMIIDEAENDVSIPCPEQNGRNMEKENMSDGHYIELQDARHLPQHLSLSTSQQFSLQTSHHLRTYSRDESLRKRVGSKPNLPSSKRQSSDQYTIQKEVVYHQNQSLSLRCINYGKLQHGLLSGSSLSEIRPEVVDDQLGTVGYLRRETFTSRSYQARQQISSLEDSNQHDKSTGELRAERLKAGKKNDGCLSFSDSESVKLNSGDPVYCPVCSRMFKCKMALKEHKKITHGIHSERNESDISQQLLDRANTEPFKCKQCGRKFTSKSVFKVHMIDKHSNASEPL